MLISPKELLDAAGLNRKGLRWLGKPLMKWLRIREVNQIYQKHGQKQGVEFIDAALAELGVQHHLPPEQLERIPKDRPFILVANHPHGIIDGLLVLRIMAEKRQDFKVMGNFLLERVEPINQWVVRMSPLTKHGNLAGMRDMVKHLSGGKPLAIFPAGTASTFHFRSGKVDDRKWRDSMGKLIVKSGMEVVPMYIHGRNKLAFQLLAPLNRGLKLALQVPIAFQHAGKTIEVRIGNPIPTSKIQSFESPEMLNAYLKDKTYQLYSE